MAELARSFKSEDTMCVLDIGATSASNIRFFTERGHRIYSQDLLEASTHPGLAIVQVQSGTFQITQGSCTPKTVGAGETFIEVPYLPVRAVATGPVSWTTTLLVHFEELPLIPWTGASPCP